MNLMTFEQFEKDILPDFNNSILNRDDREHYAIQCRPEHRREVFSTICARGSEDRSHGDIIITTPLRGEINDICIFIGARFDVEHDLIESLLRKLTYDKIVDYPEAHTFQKESAGSWGSTFGDNTPYIRMCARNSRYLCDFYECDIEALPGKIKATFEREYSGAKQYLKTIDSPEFEALKHRLAGDICHNIDFMVNL